MKEIKKSKSKDLLGLNEKLIEITNTTGKSYGVDFHLSSLGSYDTSDSNSQKIYKWKSTLELIEDKTVSSNQS